MITYNSWLLDNNVIWRDKIINEGIKKIKVITIKSTNSLFPHSFIEAIENWVFLFSAILGQLKINFSAMMTENIQRKKR